MFYFSNPNAFRSSPSPCPIEFPPTCEVRINGTAITANLKGLKKKPGTAPPAELPLRHIRLDTQSVNRVEMVYVNSQQPIQAKVVQLLRSVLSEFNDPNQKYYLVVYLVEVTTVEQLVDRLKKGKFRTIEEVKMHSTLSLISLSIDHS
jgi:E3 SUMO-protein ligase PIAS1